ncbi:sugar transferase [bacterium]|nr:sugar transferase [bacterium]
MVNRVIDVCVSLLVIVLLSPFMLFVALMIKLYDGGPVFADNPYRLGKNQRPFLMYKFRSMVPNAHEKIMTDPRYSAVKKKWILQDKLSIDEDPRITGIGKWLRRCDIDELAQFFNVLNGSMTLVGPRPWFELEFKKRLKENPECSQYVDSIFSVKPGITGLWQVSGRNSNTARQRFMLEYRYVKRRSFFYDLGIILKTPWVVLQHIIEGERYEK